MLILASASPRRRALLKLLGVPFTVRPTAVPEVPRRGETAEAFAVRAAKEKALAAALMLSPRDRRRAVVLGADTVVAIGRRMLGKPAGAKDARRMLRLLSGRTHRVVTGVAVWRGSDGRLSSGRSVTRVRFRRLAPSEIAAYAATREPLDAAGAYQIQGGAREFVARADGSYSNVVGLPLGIVSKLLAPVSNAERGRPARR